MNIKDIIGKLLKGEQLSADEKSFAEQFDHQKEIDTASAAARRKAEDKAKEAQTKLDAQNAAVKELTEKLAAAEQAAKDAGAGNNAELAKMQKQIAKLEAINAENDKKLKANARTEAIRAAAKEAGITAAQGISAAALDRLIDLSVGDTDVTDGDAMKAVLEQFKKDNPSMIAAAVKGGANVNGNPNANPFAGVPNPWKKESFNLTKQIEIEMKDAATAKTMKAEAGVPSDS